MISATSPNYSQILRQLNIVVRSFLRDTKGLLLSGSYSCMRLHYIVLMARECHHDCLQINVEQGLSASSIDQALVQDSVSLYCTARLMMFDTADQHARCRRRRQGASWLGGSKGSVADTVLLDLLVTT